MLKRKKFSLFFNNKQSIRKGESKIQEIAFQRQLFVDDELPIFGDSIDRTVFWNNNNDDVSSLVGKAVRLKFEIRNGDLYSYHFHSV